MFDEYPWQQDLLLLQLADKASARCKVPEWQKSDLAGKVFYDQAMQAIQAQQTSILENVGRLILSIRDSTTQSEKSSLANQAKGFVRALSGHPQDPMHALIDVLCLCDQVENLGTSVVKQTLTTSLHAACQSVQALPAPDWKNELQGLGVPADLVDKALLAATNVMTAGKDTESKMLLCEIDKHVNSCEKLVVHVPDPSQSEKEFLEYMSKHGSRLGASMKKVISAMCSKCY